jgi:hypothetical protein
MTLEKICGTIAIGAIISGANPISMDGSRVRPWSFATPRAVAFAPAG